MGGPRARGRVSQRVERRREGMSSDNRAHHIPRELREATRRRSGAENTTEKGFLLVPRGPTGPTGLLHPRNASLSRWGDWAAEPVHLAGTCCTINCPEAACAHRQIGFRDAADLKSPIRVGRDRAPICTPQAGLWAHPPRGWMVDGTPKQAPADESACA